MGPGLDVDERSRLTRAERAAMLKRVAELEHNGRHRERGRYERADTRRERTWWASTESLLVSLQPAPQRDKLFEDVDELAGEQDEALLDEIDAAWLN